MDAEWLDGDFLDGLSYSETHVHVECFLCRISLSKECDKFVCLCSDSLGENTILEAIEGSARTPIVIEDDEDVVQDMELESPESPNTENDDDETDEEDWLYEWRPHALELREFRMLRSYTWIPGNLLILFVELRNFND